MSARYRTMVSEDLIEAWDMTLLPEGVRIVEIGEPDPARGFYRIVTFDDDGAPEELDGQMVFPLWGLDEDRKVTLLGREVVT